MRFPLSFAGALPSSGNGVPGKPSPGKLKAIWAIRDAIFPQLERLFETHPALLGTTGASRMARHAMIPPIMVDGNRFFALARNRLMLKCGLEIRLLVNHPPASVIEKSGDLDNRLKTLFDGLRVPTGQQEIKSYCSVDLTSHEYICLLENDVIITTLQVEMMRNLAAPIGAGVEHVVANMMVTLEPSEPGFENEAFQGD